MGRAVRHWRRPLRAGLAAISMESLRSLGVLCASREPPGRPREDRVQSSQAARGSDSRCGFGEDVAAVGWMEGQRRGHRQQAGKCDAARRDCFHEAAEVRPSHPKIDARDRHGGDRAGPRHRRRSPRRHTAVALGAHRRAGCDLVFEPYDWRPGPRAGRTSPNLTDPSAGVRPDSTRILRCLSHTAERPTYGPSRRLRTRVLLHRTPG